MLYSVAFIFSVALLMPLRVHAEYLPPVLPDTSMIPDFLMTVGQYEMLNNQGVYSSIEDINHANQIVNGRTVQQSMHNTYVDNATMSTRNEWELFYDSQGNIVPVDNTYGVFGTSDVTNYSFVASKETGEILLSYDQYNELASTLRAGSGLIRYYDGIGFPSQQREQQKLELSFEEAKEDYMIVYGNQISESDAQWLESYEFSATFTSAELGWTCYIPNACTANTVVLQDGFGNQFSGSFGQGSQYAYAQIYVYSNDPSEVYFSDGKWGYLANSQGNAYNYTFNYQMYIGNWYAPFYYGGEVNINLPTAQQYTQYRELSENAVYLQPAQNEGDVTNIYNYTYTMQNPVKPNPIINNNYDNSRPTTYNNYPVTNNYNFTDLSNPADTYVQNVYNYYTQPKVDEELTANPEEIDNNVPILSNLQNRFPFSIPWDIARIFESLSAERQAPVINAEINFPIINYTWVCNIDLSMFDSTAELFRKCVLILFIVGLAVFSYSHHFGS